jgi:hypothetical protein
MKRLQNLARRRLMTFPLMGLLALVVASGCAPNPNAPSSVTGTWTGPVVSSTLGNQAFQLTLTQSGGSVTGFYTVTTPGQATSFSGALTGTVQGTSLTLLLPTGTCIRTWSATWSGTTISGSYAATGTCGNPDTGTFNLALE